MVMDKPKEKYQKLKKFKNKYRLVVLNEDTFEEKISLRLSQLNVFVIVGLSSFALIILVTIIIAFTPLRQFIPGYTDINMRKMGIENMLKMDSLEVVIAQKDLYIGNIKHIIQGNPIEYDQKTIIDTSVNYQKISDEPVEEDLLLREMIESEEKYSLFRPAAGRTPENISNFVFFTPLKGTVTSHFNIKSHHFGIDIVAPKNETVKAALDGTIIFADWTVETGYVIQLQHTNNLVSVYKHNSVLHKETGEHVKAGEVIAIVGNSGSLSTGPHLHFELWYNGIPLDPEEYMMF